MKAVMLTKCILISLLLVSPSFAEESDVAQKCDLAYDQCFTVCDENSAGSEACYSTCEEKYETCLKASEQK